MQYSSRREMLENTFLTPAGLAQRWSVTTATLANQRYRGEGVAYVKVQTAIRYRMSDVLDAELNGQRGLNWPRLAIALASYPGMKADQAKRMLEFLRQRLDSRKA